jgi:hypothetical protein
LEGEGKFILPYQNIIGGKLAKDIMRADEFFVAFGCLVVLRCEFTALYSLNFNNYSDTGRLSLGVDIEVAFNTFTSIVELLVHFDGKIHLGFTVAHIFI